MNNSSAAAKRNHGKRLAYHAVHKEWQLCWKCDGPRAKSVRSGIKTGSLNVYWNTHKLKLHPYNTYHRDMKIKCIFNHLQARPSYYKCPICYAIKLRLFTLQYCPLVDDSDFYLNRQLKKKKIFWCNWEIDEKRLGIAARCKLQTLFVFDNRHNTAGRFII